MSNLVVKLFPPLTGAIADLLSAESAAETDGESL
jgi:hypothetical protein